jgi:acid stress-induced BolA-like protein IbaG/YrbA
MSEAENINNTSGEGEQPPAGAAPQERNISPETDMLARAQGWRPQAEYTGDPDKWVEADLFVERGRNFNSKLKADLAAVQKELATFKGTAEAFAKFHKETMAAKDKEFDAAIRTLRLRKAEASGDGEHETVLTIEDQIETIQQKKQELKAELSATVPPATTEVHPIFAEWVADGNEWFNNDPKLRQYSMLVAQEFRDSGDTTQGRKFMDKVTEKMKEEFPAKFGNPNRLRPGAVAAGSASAASAGKSERDLPAVDRELMNKFVKDKLMTKEAFLKDYFSRG